jgi:hypothetical protein
MNFGQAVEILKCGNKVCRQGWNGKGMFLFYTKGEDYYMLGASNELLSGYDRLPWIGMKTADDKFVPWLASQTDILAEDWMVVE